MDDDLKGVGAFILAGNEVQRRIGLPSTVTAVSAEPVAAIPSCAKSTSASE